MSAKRVAWEPHGVLGLREEQVEGATSALRTRRLADGPGEGCVVTDPARLWFIQTVGPKRVGAASRAIYDWLNLEQCRQRVRRTIDDEGKACLERYGPGRTVVHVVGPDFRMNDDNPVDRFRDARGNA